MKEKRILQGRNITPKDVIEIQDLLKNNPEWNRTRLSRELCKRWNWVNAKSQLKDMACRTLLLKLERMNEICLPARQRPSPNANRNRQIKEIPHDVTPIESSLKELRPLQIMTVETKDKDAPLFKYLLHRYHYLGHRNCVGENLKYMIRDKGGRPLACMLFGAAAWKTKSRDDFIGWNRQERESNLPSICNNTRFLIFPWVRVPYLASHLLSRTAQKLPEHWINKYGHTIHLLETFVERDRFRGTCYRAAGWKHVGATTGRSRNDVHSNMSVPVKDVFLHPLCVDFRKKLTEEISQ